MWVVSESLNLDKIGIHAGVRTVRIACFYTSIAELDTSTRSVNLLKQECHQNDHYLFTYVTAKEFIFSSDSTINDLHNMYFSLEAYLKFIYCSFLCWVDFMCEGYP